MDFMSGDFGVEVEYVYEGGEIKLFVENEADGAQYHFMTLDEDSVVLWCNNDMLQGIMINALNASVA